MSRILAFILMFIILLNLTGCWDVQPLEDTFIVTGMGIDISKEDPNKITVTVFGASFLREAETPYVTVTADGRSLGEALDGIRNKTYRDVSIAHTMILLFSEEIAREGIRKYLDLFIRNATIGSQLTVAITNTRAEEVLSAEDPANPNTAFFLSRLIETETRKVEFEECSLRGVVNQLNERYASLMLPYIELSEDKKEMAVNRSAIFRKDKLVGILDPEYVLSLLYLRGCLIRGAMELGKVNVQGDGSKVISLRIYPKPRKIDIKVVDGRVHAKIILSTQADIYELEPPETKIDQKTLKEITTAAEQKLKQESRGIIRKLQEEYKVDSIGLSEHLRVKYPEYYKKIDWEKIFPEAKIDVEAKFGIRMTGLTR